MAQSTLQLPPLLPVASAPQSVEDSGLPTSLHSGCATAVLSSWCSNRQHSGKAAAVLFVGCSAVDVGMSAELFVAQNFKQRKTIKL